MSEVLLFKSVSVELFIESLIFILLSYAFLYTIYILKNYNPKNSSELQYSLEKKSYLITTIIAISFIIKILLLPLFVYSLDALSFIVPGAMCGAGVAGANEYGDITLILKIITILLTMLWITLNNEDEKSKNFRYFHKKIYFFLLIYVLLLLEMFLELKFLTNIPIEEPVLCCSSIYKENINLLPFNLSKPSLLILFYSLYIIIIISALLKKRYILAPLSLVFAFISYHVIVYIFSPYIYQLPTHTCPFCLLQSDYNYIGYFIYVTLLSATFYSLSYALFKFSKDDYKKIIFAYTLFVLFSSYDFILLPSQSKLTHTSDEKSMQLHGESTI